MPKASGQRQALLEYSCLESGGGVSLGSDTSAGDAFGTGLDKLDQLLDNQPGNLMKSGFKTFTKKKGPTSFSRYKAFSFTFLLIP
jgi:hypothetical protein